MNFEIFTTRELMDFFESVRKVVCKLYAEKSPDYPVAFNALMGITGELMRRVKYGTL